MKIIKMWALVDKHNDKIISSGGIPNLYPTRQKARYSKWACDKVVRVEIREVERKR